MITPSKQKRQIIVAIVGQMAFAHANDLVS